MEYDGESKRDVPRACLHHAIMIQTRLAPAVCSPSPSLQTFGPAYDKALNPLVWAVLVLILAFIIPFYRAGDWWVPSRTVLNAVISAAGKASTPIAVPRPRRP